MEQKNKGEMPAVVGNRAAGSHAPINSDMATLSQQEITAQANQKRNGQVVPLLDAADWLEVEPAELDAVLFEVFDMGDKVAITGQSKTRKSFFALLLALCLAIGQQFLGMKPTKPRRILLCQLEIKKEHKQRRVYRMARSLGIKAGQLRGMLYILNGRGALVTPEKILVAARQCGAEVIIIDPLYKLITGDENLAADLKKILQSFDNLAEETGAAVVYIHHDKKGFAGDLQLTDRGAGSGVFGRDFDTSLILTPHKEESDCMVVETVTRNYPPRAAFAIRWADYKFTESDAVPVKKTSHTSKNGHVPISEWVRRGRGILEVEGDMGVGLFRARLEDLGATRAEQTRTINELVRQRIVVSRPQKATAGGSSKIIALIDSSDGQLAFAAFTKSELQEL